MQLLLLAQMVVMDGNGNGTETEENDKDAGYDKVFKSTNGVSYKEYKQDLGYYKNYAYAAEGEQNFFSSWACPIVSAAIFFQYFGYDGDPWELYKETGAAYIYQADDIYYGENKVKKVDDFSWTEGKDSVVSRLERGEPVGIRTNWYAGGHSAVLLGYKKDSTGEYVYCSSVHTCYNNEHGGWIPLSSLYNSVNWVSVVA